MSCSNEIPEIDTKCDPRLDNINMNKDYIPSEEEKRKVEQLANQPKTLTRQQRRAKERIESEATQQLNRLQNRFMEFVINCDNPEIEAQEKRKTMSAQWKMYCNSKRFTEKARSLFDDWAVKVLDQYKIEKQPEKVNETNL